MAHSPNNASSRTSSTGRLGQQLGFAGLVTLLVTLMAGVAGFALVSNHAGGPGTAGIAVSGGASPSQTSGGEAASIRDRGTRAEVSSRSQGRSVSIKAALIEREATAGGQLSDTREVQPPAPEEPAAPVVATGDPRSIAVAMLPEFGWASDQFGCLDSLWTKESGWNPNAANPSSSAYGIPQALPGSKMASAGADWATNPATQIRWGLGYIRDRYGSPCSAYSHSQSVGWY